VVGVRCDAMRIDVAAFNNSLVQFRPLNNKCWKKEEEDIVAGHETSSFW
jgi:hypothetical protein